MGTKTKTKRQDPVAVRSASFAAAGMAPEAARLPQHGDIEVVRTGDARSGKKAAYDQARRLDAFDALKSSMAKDPFVGCYDAAKRFERDVLTSQDLHERGERGDRVDGRPPNSCRLDKVIDAAARLAWLKKRLSERDWYLLHELIAPKQQRPGWRDHAYHVTGEANWNAQGAAVRAACVNARDAYRAYDDEQAIKRRSVAA